MKTILDYLPSEPPETLLIQGRVNAHTVEKAKVMMKQDGLTWNEVLEACLNKFVEEMEARYEKRK